METGVESEESQQNQQPAAAPPRRRWHYLVLGLFLVTLVGGAYWNKTQVDAPRSVEATSEEALMKAGLDTLHVKKDPAAAIPQFRQVLALNPAHYGATYQLASALDLAGQPGEARVYWQKMLSMAEAIKDEPTLGAVRARLQRPLSPEEQQAVLMSAGLDALHVRKDPKTAAGEFRKVLALNPTHYGATYQLATALDRAGEPAEARPLWEKVLKMAEAYKDSSTVATAKARLASRP